MIVRSRVRLSAGTLLCCLMVVTGGSAHAIPPVVAGFERFGKADAASGQLLLGELNCTSCHKPAEATALVKQAPVLDNVGTRIRAGYFKKYLADPQSVKPGSTMPHVFAGDPDSAGKVEALAHFLASTGSPKQEASDPKAATIGRDVYHKVGCAACHGTRDANGQTDKTTASSVPLGDLKAKYTLASLAAFLTNPHVARPSGRMPALLFVGDPKTRAKEARELANYLIRGAKVIIPVVFQKAPAAKDEVDQFEISVDLAAKGKLLFASEGCANCHQMKDSKSDSKAPSLAKLQGTGGCLANAPVKGIPWFGLSAAQKAALTAAIKVPAVATKDPGRIIANSMLAFNCYACHGRDKVGGPDDDLNKTFATTQPEMGDEARIPPLLDNVGGKLNLDYLKNILNSGSHDRPYMLTRMPAFGQPNVMHLASAFGEADKGKFAPVANVAFAEPIGKIKGIGRHMVGAQAFGCIKCHTFAGNKAEGVQGMDMTLFPKRLQRDWFHAYLFDPQKIRAGTRMPSAFDKGKSILPAILDGTAVTQTEAMWAYLSDAKVALPEGVKKQSIPLRPLQDAIVYRNFIQGAGNRAIGVGYPEKVNIAFDANEMRLAMIWQGSFIDAGRHWNGRGEGSEPPLGDNVLHLPAGSSFAVLDGPEAIWPKANSKIQGFKFDGYHLTPDERPTFLYSLGDTKIEDFPNALVIGKDTGLRRTFNVTAAKDAGKLYFRAAVGNKIEASANGVYIIDGAVLMKLTSPSAPTIRSSAGKMELIVPVLFTNGKSRIVQEYSW